MSISVVLVRKLDPRRAFWMTGTLQCSDKRRAASAMIASPDTVSAGLHWPRCDWKIDWSREKIDFSYSGKRQSRVCVCLNPDLFHVNNFVLSVPTTRSSDTSLLTHSAYRTPFTTACSSLAAASGMRSPVKPKCTLDPCSKATIRPLRRSEKARFVGRCLWISVQSSQIEVATSRGLNAETNLGLPRMRSVYPTTSTLGANSSFLDSPTTGLQTDRTQKRYEADQVAMF